MADDILKNIWNELSSKGKTDSEFDAWKTNMYDNEDVQNNVYGYLKDNGYTDSEFGDWKANALPAKTNDSASADPAVESENNTGSQSENGLSGSRDASDFENTQEKATAIERTFGKNEFTDFVGDIYRAWDAGTEAGSSVNEAFDVYKGKDSTDEELYAFLDKTRSIEEKGQTDEMLGASEKMAELKKEGYNGVSAFFGGWWDNPTAMLQYTVMSLSQMGRALVDSEEVAGTALAAAGVGAGVGAVAGLAGGPFAPITSTAGAITGTIGGFFGGLSGSMEAGMTTAALIQEEAVKDGLDWGNLSDKERFDYVRKVQNDTEKFNEIRSNALARGVAIGAIDGIVGGLSGGIGNAAFKSVAAGSKSALAGVAKVASVAALETTGGMLSEVAGQAAAEQEFNLEEILIEGFADKTFTGISLAQAATQGTPKYILNGQKLNGKQFSEALKIMSDKAYVSADIKIENSPAAQQLVNNRRQDIAADQKVDSRVSNIDDRSAAIKLTKEQNSLKGNPEGNKTRLDQIKVELNNISEKYADSDVDVTIEQRQQAVAAAVENKFESQFNKNVKAASDGGKKIGLKTTVYKTDLGYKKAIEKAFGKLPEGWNSSEGVFAGNGKLFINKAQAKRSINIATGNTGAISVASHEVLHPIFNALIGGATTQGEFVQQFRTRMTGKQKTYVDSQLKKRGYDKSVTGIELMNIFSDGIVKNEINYDQTLFEKLGDSIVRLFKGEGFDKLSFDNGKDVYNFLKEYNTSIKEGKLSDKAISTIKEAEGEKKVKVADAKRLEKEQLSKTLTPEQSTELKTDIASIKEIAAENEALAKKYGKEPIKGRKQTKLEEKVLTGIKAVVDKLITSRTKALYDPIAEDAKRNVTRQEFKDSMRTDLEVMVLNEYDGSQELEKFIINRGYLRANNLAKRLGIESQEDGGIKSDVDAAKDIVSTKDTQSIDRSGNVERGQATFDQLDIVDDKLISEIESEVSKELRMRASKGTLSEMISVKKGRETYFVSWLENFVDKTLFKKILKKWGAIGESKGVTVIPPGYIDFLNSKEVFDIVTKALPVKTIKKSYGKLFKVEKVGRELTPEGNPVFKIAPIDKKTFLQYFLDGKKTTILERQKQLAREVITPVVKTVVAEYATPENLAALKEINELAPAEALDVIGKISLDAQLNELESKLDRYEGEQTGFDIIQFSKRQLQDNGQTALDETRLLDQAKAIVPAIRGIAKDFGYDFENQELLLSNKAKGIQLFNYNNTLKFYKTREKLMKFMPTELTKFRGTTNALLGFIYREDGSSFPFSKNKVKKLINKNGKEITNETTLKEFEEKSYSYYKNNLYDKKASTSKYSKETKNRLKAFNKLLIEAELTKNEGFTTNAYRVRKAKALLNNNNSTETVIGVLKDLSKSNELKTAAAELYISLLRDFVNSSSNKTEAIKAVIVMLVSNRNTVNALRSFSTVDRIVYDSKNKNTKYHFEHDTAMARIIPGVFRMILGDGPISFYSKATLVPKQVATIRDSNPKTKTSNADVFMSLLKTEVDKNNYSTALLNSDGEIIQFSKTLKEDFNTIIEDATKGSKSRINTNTVPVYHGGEVNSIKDINGFIYFSDDKAQAQEYAKGNYGDVKNFTLKESDIVPEADVFKVIRELDIQPKEKGWTVDDSRLYELIDDRFEQSFTKVDIKKLKAGLKKKGIKASRFTDSDMKTGKDIENIVVFDKSVIQFSKTIDQDFNNIIEGATGIESFKRFSEAKGKVRGRGKGKYKFFIPPSADDFAGLIGRLLGKGKEGDINAAWFKENLFNPFAKGIRDFEAYKEQTTHMVKALKKRIKNVPNGLSKINETGFTNEAAVRVYLWAKNGYDISGLSATDQKDLIEIIENNKALKDFANELDQTFNGYPEPNNDWLAGTVTTDIINMVNTTKRAEFLESWQENSDIIFSKENINKLRAAYGDNYVEALQDMLYRMKTGRNRPSGANKLTNKFMNWVNDSVGTIMFFNTRSALLQTLSIANFINWGDNNPAKAAMAFANQKQFWADFAMLFNSNFLKQRRSGLKNDVNADDIANAAESATNKSKAVLASLLKLGFLPTQMADSFAIAMGGASFIRNRINKYVSEGMDTKAAEEQAFLDFQEVAEETQQSSRPDRISQQQASPLGRIILAFANTPMQYMRLTKKAFLDLKNGRGDVKTNISKIVYYTFIQNIIFSSLQAALFASMFEDEEEEVVDNREIRIANSMLDSILRGAGIYGAIASTGKNIIMEIDKQSKKGRPDFTQAAIRSLDLSPPLSSKIRKLMSAGRAFSYSNVRDKMTGYGLDNPAFYAGGQIVSAVTNIPLDRAIKKADNLRVAVDNDTKLWQSIALGLGYSQWDLGLVETTTTKKKSKWGNTVKWKKAGNWKKDWKSKNK